MKIKTFDFEISNLSMYPSSSLSQSCIDRNARNLSSTEEIDNIINSWIEATNAVVQDIKVDIYTAERHNNACGDWVRARYTILYIEWENYNKKIGN